MQSHVWEIWLAVLLLAWVDRACPSKSCVLSGAGAFPAGPGLNEQGDIAVCVSAQTRRFERCIFRHCSTACTVQVLLLTWQDLQLYVIYPGTAFFFLRAIKMPVRDPERACMVWVGKTPNASYKARF